MQQAMKRWGMGAFRQENLAFREVAVAVPAAGKVLVRAVATGGRISMIGVLAGNQVSGPAGPLLKNPVIDGHYGLADLPAALDHLGRGAFGKVVIDFTR